MFLDFLYDTRVGLGRGGGSKVSKHPVHTWCLSIKFQYFECTKIKRRKVMFPRLYVYRVFRYLCPPPPQTNSGVVQTIQIHCSKLEPFSAIDFKGFCFLSIFTIYTVNLKKRDPFPIGRRNVEIGQSSMTLHTMSWTLIGDKSK